jgi:hypothetical protein
MIVRPPFTGFLKLLSSIVNFVTDSFTEGGTGTSSLNSHTGELGATWTQHPHANYAGGPMLLDADLDAVYGTGTSASYASGAPPSADYYVQADIFLHTAASQNIAICARMHTTDDTMYLVRLNNGTTWELRKIVTTAATTLGSSTNQIPSLGSSKTVKLVVSGTSISVYVNGVLEIGPVTDSAISAAGKAGVRNAGSASATTGAHLNNFSAQ